MSGSKFVFGTVLWFTLALSAGASDLVGNVSDQLRAQGYDRITASSTWLGRIRIVAGRSDGMREIVLDSRTGEVLRDVWQVAPRTGGTPDAVAPSLMERPAKSGVDGVTVKQPNAANWDNGDDASAFAGSTEESEAGAADVPD
ncbi:hypothetical protein QKW60_19390 [Defluviimonas aestuarii]|uniref:hypothetical protein n=1 Tax=Albidovulum aestuarii TaxID=1130726 RepID=UPI00249CB4A5|nr:hypothetical protein [Defluviimonas aestuarii]MDI3338581.1 hypothetical protein [Defluviimonas aestuarii]